MNPHILNLLQYDLAESKRAQEILKHIHFDEEALRLIYEGIEFSDIYAKIFEELTSEERDLIFNSIVNNTQINSGR